MGPEAIQRLSIQEYLDLEASSESKHEFHDGQIFAMAGASRNHGIIGANILTELNLISRKHACTTFNGDVKIRIEAANRFVYPEASVICGEIQSSDADPDAIINPMIVAEVLSDSTEAYDRGAKFRLYQQLPSFQEYILIDQYRPIVSVFFLKGDNIWEMREITDLAEHILLQSLEARISMQEIYRNVEGLNPLY